MRNDMYKVIVERPRRGKDRDAVARRLRSDHEGPAHLSMRAGYGYRTLNENLAPLRRYLAAQVGRPWRKVFSEMSAVIDRRNTVQQHIWQHVDDFIATRVVLRDGKIVDLAGRFSYGIGDEISQELYVDPASGLIRRNRNYMSWSRRRKVRYAANEAEVRTRRRVIDKRTQLLLLEGEWYEVKLALVSEFMAPPLPLSKPLRASELSQPPYVAYDVVLRHVVKDWKSNTSNGKARGDLYGSPGLYAVKKRQLSKREIEMHGLRGSGVDRADVPSRVSVR
jgi:hypothetical protein